MNKKALYKTKKQLIKQMKLIDDNSKDLLKKLGFSIKYDNAGNMYIWDDMHDERMYTNTLSIAGLPYRCSENKYFTLEFCLFNKKITNLTLYNKKNGHTKTLKIEKTDN